MKLTPGGLGFPPPLRISIPLLVLAFSLGYDVISTMVQMRGEIRREYERVIKHAVEDAKSLVNAATAGQTLRGDAFVRYQLDTLAAEAELNWGLLCDAQGRILDSSQEAWKGKRVADVAPVAAEFLGKAMEGGQASVGGLVSDTDALAVERFANNSAGQVMYSLVNRDPSPAVQRERHESLHEGIISGGIHLGACLLLWLALRPLLVRRMKRILKQAQPLGDTKTNEAPLRGSDEFAMISRTLWDRDNLLRKIVKYSRDVLYMLSKEGHVLYVSPSGRELWGMTPDQQILNPRAWTDAVVEEDRPRMMSMLEPLYGDKPMVKCEYRVRRPDGQLRWVESRAFSVLDSQGELWRIAGLTMDITERRLLQQEILEISENERRTMGYDLHDDLCQRLAAIKVHAEILANQLKRNQSEHVEKAYWISQQIGDAATHCRRLARGLSPVNLQGGGLLHALEGLVETARKLYEMKIYLDCPEPVVLNNVTTATHLYRITQELISNAARHAKPTQVYVGLRREGKHLRLEVANDGAKFTDSGEENRQGMGLRIIRYRANVIGASFQFLTEEASGATAVCLVPESACQMPINTPT